MSVFLTKCAQHGRWILVAGLLVGTLLPSVAELFRPHIAVMVALLLLTSCVRIGYRKAVGALNNLQDHIGVALILQLGVPLVLVSLFSVSSATGPLVTALIIMSMAAPIAGSPNLAMMMGADPAPPLRQLVLGTAILPITCLPILFFVPGIGDVSGVMESTIRLLMLIFGAAVTGFTIRAKLLRDATDDTLVPVDGLSALFMGLIVIGLMTEVGDSLFNQPSLLFLVLLVAFAANLGSQFLFGYLAKLAGRGDLATTTGIAAGNRNMALFLAALPAAVTDPILLFIGCYQIPMYLTPLMMEWFYRRFG